MPFNDLVGFAPNAVIYYAENYSKAGGSQSEKSVLRGITEKRESLWTELGTPVIMIQTFKTLTQPTIFLLLTTRI
jgi:hypothetical protein